MKTIMLVAVGIFIGWYGALAYGQTRVYTDKNGAVIGYGTGSGNQTTYTDRTGKVQGYENRIGNTSVYTSPSGAYEGSQNRLDSTDRYGIDPAQRGRSRDDD